MAVRRTRDHPNHERGELASSTCGVREQARAAIEAGDKRRALLLLRGVATRDLDGTSLSDGEARTLVAVAADAPAEKVHADTGDRQRRKAKSAILPLLQAAELEADDLDEIDRVVHERQRVEPFRGRPVALIVSDGNLSTSLDDDVQALRIRLAAHGSALGWDAGRILDAVGVSVGLRSLLGVDVALIVLIGGSVTDPEDRVLQTLEALGGRVDQLGFGLPAWYRLLSRGWLVSDPWTTQDADEYANLRQGKSVERPEARIWQSIRDRTAPGRIRSYWTSRQVSRSSVQTRRCANQRS